jgi:hypothetical protein
LNRALSAWAERVNGVRRPALAARGDGQRADLHDIVILVPREAHSIEHSDAEPNLSIQGGFSDKSYGF